MSLLQFQGHIFNNHLVSLQKLFKQNGFTDMYIKGEHRSEHAIMLCYTYIPDFFF